MWPAPAAGQLTRLEHVGAIIAPIATLARLPNLRTLRNICVNVPKQLTQLTQLEQLVLCGNAEHLCETDQHITPVARLTQVSTGRERGWQRALACPLYC